MSPTAAISAAICALEDLGVLRFRGADAARFLQGQISNDIALLAQQPGLLAGFHNPQGRVLALLRLVQPVDNDILAVLPAALTGPTLQSLRRFVLRAKVTISDESPGARVFGYAGSWPPADLPSGATALPVPTPGPPPAAAGSDASGDAQRGLIVDLTGTFHPAGTGLTREQWHALDIAAGLPQVYAATSAQFVAQMLNLDCVGGISFNKGCYTGQEVIARAHYRGRVKRRLRRLRTAGPATLVPGDTIHLPDGRTVQVVDVVQTPDGRCEFLAVTTPAPGQAAPAPGQAAIVTAPNAGTPEMAASCGSATTPIDVIELPLPYALPD